MLEHPAGVWRRLRRCGGHWVDVQEVGGHETLQLEDGLIGLQAGNSETAREDGKEMGAQADFVAIRCATDTRVEGVEHNAVWCNCKSG